MQPFSQVADILVMGDSIKLSEYLLGTFIGYYFSNFIDMIHFLFIQDIAEVEGKCFKTSSKSLKLCLKHPRISQLLFKKKTSSPKLYLSDVLKDGSDSLFLQSKTENEKIILSRVFRGKAPIPREKAIDALARMCKMRLNYITQCTKKGHAHLSKLLTAMFDLYPNYLFLARQMREYQCDLRKILNKGLKIIIGYPIRYHPDKIQIHLDCLNNEVRFYYRAKLLERRGKSYSDCFKHFIAAEKECVIDTSIQTITDDDFYIFIPYDIFLCDDIQHVKHKINKRKDYLQKIIRNTNERIPLENNTCITFEL